MSEPKPITELTVRHETGEVQTIRGSGTFQEHLTEVKGEPGNVTYFTATIVPAVSGSPSSPPPDDIPPSQNAPGES